MVTPKGNFELMEVRQILFADRPPVRDRGELAAGFLFQQRYDKSKRRENSKEPLHRRNRYRGMPERSIAPSNLPKQELASKSDGSGFVFA